MIRILKASAGSGKTYNLARTYLELIFRMRREGSQSSFRNILAVTFTNKATGEMKNRILKELHVLSTDTASSGYAAYFVPGIFATAEELRAASSEILLDILHDYSAFSISTIDKFFQQTLRCFAREMGRFSPYQVELDRKSLIHESVDRMLDSLTGEDKDLLDWMTENVASRIESGEKVALEKTLYEISEKLKSADVVREDISREDLRSVRKECDRIVKDFEERFFARFDPPRDYKPGARLKLSNKAQSAALGDLYPRYCTAWLIRARIWGLGTAQEFFRNFDMLSEEKNVMCLDESSGLLREIIDDCEAPFVYEKTGTWYEHFLLDEFQDTSLVQWENFLPLLRESDSHGYMSLIVGDVKQSIYRWRGSQWSLLARDLQKEFPLARTSTLASNWRSTRAVVEFNNSFFPRAAAILHKTDIYDEEGTRQEACFPDEAQGCVDVTFCPEKEIDAHILESIGKARGAGAALSDIAILVRGNATGSRIAGMLIDNGIDVVTDDSLDVRKSELVMRLTSLMSMMDNPLDRVSFYCAGSMGIEVPSAYHSLVDLAERLLAALMKKYPSMAEGQALFVQSFMDALQDWVGVNGNNLRAFLSYWKEAEVKISSPSDVDAVRIMTVHKAKGLEFNYVIFPYAHEVGLYKSTTVWCSPGEALGPGLNHNYPVDLSKDAADSCFRDAFRKEYDLQVVDNLNIFYVAMTRAVYGMHVIAKEPSVACRAAAEKGNELYPFVNMSELLYFHTRTFGTHLGTMPDFGRIKRKADRRGTITADYVSYPVPSGLSAGRQPLEEGARREGIVLHGILSEVVSVSDLPKAVDDAVRRGDIASDDSIDVLRMLTGAVESHPEWFPEDPSMVRNEISLIGEDGSESRPDRVVAWEDGSVGIVDYKFGSRRSSYHSQLRRYMNLYRSLGYGTVRGYVWYIREGIMEEVDADRLD